MSDPEIARARWSFPLDPESAELGPGPDPELRVPLYIPRGFPLRLPLVCDVVADGTFAGSAVIWTLCRRVTLDESCVRFPGTFRPFTIWLDSPR